MNDGLNNAARLLALLLLLPFPAAAQFWTVEGEVRSSTADATSWLASVDRSIGENGLVFVTLVETRVDVEGADLDTSSQTLGGSWRMNERWRLSGFVERWGKSGDLVSDRVSATLSRDTETVGLSLTGGIRWITLAAGAPIGEPDPGGPPIDIPVDPGGGNGDGDQVAEDFDLQSRQLGLRGHWDITEAFTLAAGGSTYEYDRDASQLAARERVEQLNESAVSLAQGFLDRSLYIEGRYDFGDYRELSLSVGRDRSAVDGRTARTVSAAWIQPLGRAWDLRLEAGRTRTEGFDASRFGGISLTWYP